VLIRLLRSHLLRPYRTTLLIVLALQSVQAIASLYLPSLNADIIDKGIVAGDTGYIWRTGGFMLLVTLVQIVFNVAAVFFGSRAAMGFGRDVRDDLFHRVTDFSAREVSIFGAPSLITRITNDVQQVQLLVAMSCTMLLAAPITIVGGVIMALRQDAGLTWLLLVSIVLLVASLAAIVSQMVPTFRLMQERIDGINRVLREQITGLLLVRFVQAFSTWYEVWSKEGFEPIREGWLQTAWGVGGPITVRLDKQTLTGTFADLDADGALLLDLPSGQRQRITAGDVFFPGPAPSSSLDHLPPQSD
jgi:ABC-type multidrug transport system fused ATPase/permease subunit